MLAKRLFSAIFSPIMKTPSKVSKIEFAAGKLRNMLRDGTLKPGMRLASSADIAKSFHVSLMTADRAIRQLVSEGRLKRITGSGTFVLSETAKRKICLLDTFPNYMAPFIGEVLYRENTYPVIEKEFLKYNVEVQQAKSWEEAKNMDMDGLLCSEIPPLDFSLKVPAAIFRRYRLLDGPLIQCVPDLENVMRQLCEKLTRRKKLKRIHVFYTSDSNIRYFAEIFILWAKRYGLGDKLIQLEKGITPGQSPFQLGYEFGNSLPDVRSNVIFTTSDFRASGILKALDDRGFRTGDYDLISCNNWEAYGYRPFPKPRLTSIEFRRMECLQEVIRSLCTAVLTPREGQITITKFPALLKIRESALQW